MKETIQPDEAQALDFDDELSDESLDCAAAGSTLICVGWCRNE